jgi:hypothetical protein
VELKPKKAAQERGVLTQAALILESGFVLLLGVLAGVFMPDELIMKARQLASNSLLNFSPGHLKYVMVLLAVFVIFHQYFCWMWLIRISSQVFLKRNWGEIYFVYTIICLFLFSVCFGFMQILWA